MEPGDASTQQSLQEELLVLYAGPLFSHAMRLTREPADGWDLLQDTFERVWRHLPLMPKVVNVRAWLLVVMQNLELDRCRAARRYKPTTLPEESFDPREELPLEPTWQCIEAAQVRKCVMRLEPRLRDAYLLRVDEGLSLAATAARLGVPVATVGTRVFRARRRLRTLLQNTALAPSRFGELGTRPNGPVFLPGRV